MVRPGNSMIMDLVSYFSGCQVSFLIRSSTEWNTMTMNRHSVSPQMVLVEALHIGKAYP